ncbi:MAG: D-alanyl-D-alanine carboxypeptidase family protein [Pyrinomonadaceae bacterium]
MKSRKKESLVVAALAAAVLAVAATLALPSHGQSGASPAARQASQEVARTADATKAADANKPATDATTNAATRANATAATSTTNAAAASSASAVAFADAARQNAALRDSLDWVFGGKQQRGWTIYEPLIARTVAAQAASESNDFALAVSRWQSSFGLQPSGVLDRDSWMRLVAEWQSRRLKDHTYPSPDQLVTVSSSEFYDTARPAQLRQVERTTYAAYRRMIAAAVADKSLGLRADADGSLAADERFLKIVSAFRPKEYQDQLRRQQPEAGRAALAVNSPHFTGRALDLYVGGYDPVSTKDDNRALQTQTKVYQWLVKNAESFGFRPYYYEPWHWEYVGN